MALALRALQGVPTGLPSAADGRIRRGKIYVFEQLKRALPPCSGFSLGVRSNSILRSIVGLPGSPRDIDDPGLVGAAVCNCYEIGLRNFLYIPMKSRG
jgi:hypothetical protein